LIRSVRRRAFSPAHLLDRRACLVVHQAPSLIGVRPLLRVGRDRLARYRELSLELLAAGIDLGRGLRRARGAAAPKQAPDGERGEDACGEYGDSAQSRDPPVRFRLGDDTILRLYSLHFLLRPAPTFPRGARDGGAA
jgi:hypothetical protein